MSDMQRLPGIFGHLVADEGFGREVLRLAKLFWLSCREPIEAVEKVRIEWLTMGWKAVRLHSA